MVTTTSTQRRRRGAAFRTTVRRYRSVIAAAVQGVALLLRLPLVAHVIVTVATQVALVLLTGRRCR
jgi:hypothetical protein